MFKRRLIGITFFAALFGVAALYSPDATAVVTPGDHRGGYCTPVPLPTDETKANLSVATCAPKSITVSSKGKKTVNFRVEVYNVGATANGVSVSDTIFSNALLKNTNVKRVPADNGLVLSKNHRSNVSVNASWNIKFINPEPTKVYFVSTIIDGTRFSRLQPAARNICNIVTISYPEDESRVLRKEDLSCIEVVVKPPKTSNRN